MTWVAIVLLIILGGVIFYIAQLRQRIVHIRKDEIKRMEVRRSGFISIISHQLRTPLSVIKGYLEALLTGDQGSLTEGQKEYLDDALKINKDTIKLANDYLDAVRLDSEKMSVKPQPLDLTKVVKEEIEILRLLAKAYNCELKFEEPPRPLPKAMADPIKIRQVIENIMANAIKYTSGRGRAIITLEEKGNNVLFKCQDIGVGIPADQQAEIFTKFFRARNIFQKDTKGSGLGLYLAKTIIEALGGKIWIKSAEGKGTTVFFQLLKYS